MKRSSSSKHLLTIVVEKKSTLGNHGGMKLAQLFTLFPHLKWGDAAVKDVASICSDSRLIEKNCIFVAVRGGRVDGHQFLKEAAEKGAIGLVVEDESQVPANFLGAMAVVQDSRVALNRLAARWVGDPATRLYCAGVTGTNGKTTVTYMIECVLRTFGWPTGVIGTINHHLGEHVWQTEMTTPDPLSFQRRLQEFEMLGARAVAMEVSSHALKQSRVDEVLFDVAVFTNLTRDHLDYHPDMEDYFLAKARLFSDLLAHSTKQVRHAIINKDDTYGKRLVTMATSATVWTYAEHARCEENAASPPKNPGEREADLSFEILKQDFEGTHFQLRTPRGERPILLPMPGLHNVYNATAAIGVGLAAGAGLETCANAIEEFAGVPGRLEKISNKKGLHIFVDYAHTDDALRGVLQNLNKVRAVANPKSQLITVFGCGGDRDRGKRSLMMKAALEGSDRVVVTSDNPRTEDPLAIIADALTGASHVDAHRILREPDRRRAIALALSEARAGDVVLVAGKGHETYQQVGAQKFPFSDVEVVREILGN